MGGENKLTFWQRVKGAFGPIDLTKGGITKGIILFALPIILSYLFQQIYTISDAAICGQTLSSGRVAGINDSTSLIYIPAVRVRIYCGFLRYHVTAHRRGAGHGQVGIRARCGSGRACRARSGMSVPAVRDKRRSGGRFIRFGGVLCALHSRSACVVRR